MSHLRKEIDALERAHAKVKAKLDHGRIYARGAKAVKARKPKLYYLNGKFYDWNTGAERLGPTKPTIVGVTDAAGQQTTIWTWVENGERAWGAGVKKPAAARQQSKPKITKTQDTWGEAWWYSWPPAGVANLAAEIRNPTSFGGINWHARVWSRGNRSSEPSDQDRAPTKAAAVALARRMLHNVNNVERAT